MKLSAAFFLILLIFCLSFTSNAQTSKEPEKSREQIALEAKTYKLLAQIAEETVSLKLAENRALVDGIVGNLLWEKDEKLARRVFADAASELTQAHSNPKKRFQGGNENFDYRSLIYRNLRGQVIYNILPKDEKLALEVFYATRPPEIEDAVRAYRQIAAETGKNPDLASFKQDEMVKFSQAVSEIYQEQSLKKAAAKNDPQALAQNLRESIAGGTDFQNFLPDLDALNKKDHDAAQKILVGLMAKLSEEDYLPYAKSYVAYLLYERVLAAKKNPPARSADEKNKELEFDEKTIKTIAGKELDKLLAPDSMFETFQFVERAMYLRKILPERAAELKPRLDKLKSGDNEWIKDNEASDKLGANPTISQIAESSSNLSGNSRSNFYNNAINRLAETETPEKVAQAIQKIPDEKDREKAFEYLKTIAANKAKDKDLSEAKKAALEIKNERDKIAALVNLAVAYRQKNTEESQKIAEDLMTEAAAFVNLTPETESDFDELKPFIDGYATVKPEKTFELLAPIIEKSNELINAYVLLTNYHNKSYPYVEDNEIIFGAQEGYSSFSGAYKNLARKLATSDFERAVNLVQSFQRADVRIAAKLILVQSILTK